MTPELQLHFCSVCINRQPDAGTKIVCSLNINIAGMEDMCPSYSVNKEAARKMKHDSLYTEDVDDERPIIDKKPVIKGILGGGIIIVTAIVWFFAMLDANIVYVGAAALIITGIVIILRGLAEGNVIGRKRKHPSSNDYEYGINESSNHTVKF